MNKEIEIHNFENKNVRIIGTHENPWFAVKDICNILELSNVTVSLNNIPEKWKGIKKVLTPSGDQNMLTVNEAGLYKLIMRSNKPIAEKFQEWVCEEVLPSIRKKGEYKMKEMQEKISQLENENKEISRLILRKNKRNHKIGDCVYIVTNKNIPNQFKLGQTDDINNRMISFNNANPDEFILHKSWYTRFNKKVEKLAHDIFQKFRVSLSNEWFESCVLDKVIEYITKQIELLEKFDTKEELLSVQEEKDFVEPIFINDRVEKKQCKKCLLSLPFSKFYLRKDTDEESNDKYRSHCKKCCNQKMKEIRKEIKKDANYNKKTCKDCERVLTFDLFYKKEDETLHENCIKCFNAKNNLSDNIKQCNTCKKIKETTYFQHHSKGILRSNCKVCRNKSIVEQRKKLKQNI